MESHVDGELFDVKMQLNQLKDLQLERKKLDELESELQSKFQRVSLLAERILKPDHIGVDNSGTSRDHFDKKEDITTQHKSRREEPETHLHTT